MVKELHEAYMYSNTARDLWVELEEKFGEIDRPRIFQLKKQLTTMKQGNDSLALYSNKMKKIWEELNCLEPQPRCTCDAKEKTEEMHSSNQVMQFLMGLGDAYEGVVSNILMMDPMPPFNKIYSMVSRIEKQRDITVTSDSFIETNALAVKSVENNKGTGNNNNKYLQRKKEKMEKFCTHCHKNGHTEDICFKKHGYPEWFKELRNKKDMAHAVQVEEETDKQQGMDTTMLASFIQKEF